MKSKGYLIFMVIVLSLVLSSCTFPDTERLAFNVKNPTYFDPVKDKDDFFLAVAVSGGGSRSAYWTACVLENLFRQVKLPDERSILDEIDYISSVSGGSLASAYYCMNKPKCDTSNEGEYEKFFKKFKEDMKRNVQRETFLYPWRWNRIFYRSPERGVFLCDTFARECYCGDGTFRALYDRQKEGYCPTLIINGTLMDTGEKFLFTTLPRFCFADMIFPEGGGGYYETNMYQSNLDESSILVRSRFCEDFNLDIGAMKVSRAVMASAGVPLLFGPAVLEDQANRTIESTEVYYHVSDGGVRDNLGIEAILQLILTEFADKDNRKYRGGLVIIIDCNPRIYQTNVGKSVHGPKLGETLGRATEIMFQRGKYLVYNTIALLQAHDERFEDIYFVIISTNDHVIAPGSLEVPTAFKLAPRHARRLERSAEWVVEGVKDRILANYEGSDYQE